MVQNVDSYKKTIWINTDKTECLELFRSEDSIYAVLNAIRLHGRDTSYIRVKFTHGLIKNDYYRFKIEQISVDKTTPTKYKFNNQVQEIADSSKDEENPFGDAINNRNKNGLSNTINDAIKGNLTEYWIYFGESILFINNAKMEEGNDKLLKIQWANMFDNSASNQARYHLVQE